MISVHVNEPGRTEWEGYETATKAGAASGITTIVDMPLNSIPPTTTVANFQTKLEAAKGKCFVDVAFWGGVVPRNKPDLKPLLAKGVKGGKISDVVWPNYCQVGYGVSNYRTRAIITRSRFEMALDYKLRILGPTFLVYVLN